MGDEKESATLAGRVARLMARGEIMEPGLYADGARGWHNFDEVWAPIAEGPARMAAVRTAVPDFHAEDIVPHPWPGGFALEYAFVGTTIRGDKVRIVGCIVATVAGGRITQMKEYVDTAQAMQALAALAAQG